MNEGFIKLFKNIHQFEESRHADVLASLKGWFKRILVNTCIDHYRKNASYINGQMLSEDAENIADKQETGIDILSYKEIIEAIRQLSPAYRTVFNLFVIEGLTHEEIAEHLGISIGSSKSNLSKAREEKTKRIFHNRHGVSGEIDARVTHSDGTEMVRIDDRWFVASEIRQSSPIQG